MRLRPKLRRCYIESNDLCSHADKLSIGAVGLGIWADWLDLWPDWRGFPAGLPLINSSVFQHDADVFPGLLEWDSIDPDICIRLEIRAPAVDGSGAGVVGGQSHGRIAVVALEHVGNVATAQADIQRGPFEGLGPGALELEGSGDLPCGSRHQLHQADSSGPGACVSRESTLASRDGEQQGRVNLVATGFFLEQVGVCSRKAALEIVEVAVFPEGADGAFMPTPLVGGDGRAIELFLAALTHQVVPFLTRVHDAPLVEELAGALQRGRFFRGDFVQRGGGIVQGMRPVESLGCQKSVVAAVVGDFLEQLGAFGGTTELFQRAGLPVRAHLLVRIGIRQFLGGFQDLLPVPFVQGQAQAHVSERAVAQIRGRGFHQ